MPTHTACEDEMAEAQREDETVGEIIRLKETGTVLTSDIHHTDNRAVKKLLYGASIVNGWTSRQTVTGQTIISPGSEVQALGIKVLPPW